MTDGPIDPSTLPPGVQLGPDGFPLTLGIPRGFHVANLPMRYELAHGPDLVTLFLRFENLLVGGSFDVESAMRLSAQLRTEAQAAKVLAQPKLVVPGLVVPGAGA